MNDVNAIDHEENAPRDFTYINCAPCRAEELTSNDLRQSLDAEIIEMEKYKWYLGEKLQHDPLNDRSLNEIYCEWIEKYAADFRRDWKKRQEDAN